MTPAMTACYKLPELRSKRVLLLLLAALLCQCLRAQMNVPSDNVIPPSPQAAALMRYAQVPVSLYTGVPNIQIPIWEIRGREFSLPVNLSYHGGGNRVEALATRTGLGWSLSAGGAISRAIRSQPDELELGFLYFASQYNQTSMHQGTQTQVYERYKEMSEGCLDTEPDMFNFNINGLVGTFSYNWDRTLVISCNEKVKITNVSGTDGISSWELTGPDGTRYIFAAAEITHYRRLINPADFNDAMKAPCIDRSAVSSWYVSRIISPNYTDTLTFTYNTYFQRYQLTASEQLMHREGYGSLLMGNTKTQRILEVTGKDLASIQSSTGVRIEFAGTTTRQDISPVVNTQTPYIPQGSNCFSLDKILVKNAAGQVVRQFGLKYDYVTGRLSLREVAELTGDGMQQKPAYKLYYNSITLPQVDSYSQDHWGFYNGASNTTLIPPTTLYSQTGSTGIYYDGGNRAPWAEGMKAGQLEKIVYPTGGSTTFEFEAHDVSYTVSEIPKVMRSASAGASGPPGDGLYEERDTFTIYQRQIVRFQYSSTGYAYGDPSMVPYIDLRSGSTPYFMYRHADAKSEELYFTLEPGFYTLVAGAMMEGSSCTATVEWEQTTSSTPVTRIVTETIGGLRIRKITEEDGLNESPATIRKFIYQLPGGASSGSRVAPLIQYEYPFYFREDPAQNPTYVTVRIAYNAIQSSMTQGSTVGYREVITLFGDNGQFGKNIAKFSSPEDHPDQAMSANPFPPATNYDFMRGCLTESLEYKWENNTHVLVKKIQNTYTHKDEYVSLVKVGLAIGGAEQSGGSFGGGVPDLGRYAIGGYANVFGIRKPTSTIETHYLNGKTYVKESGIQYDPTLLFVKSTTEKQSDGRETMTEFFYPSDYASPTSVINTMKTRHMLNTLIEQVSSEKDKNGVRQYLGGAVTEYALFGNKILPSKLHRLLTAKPLASYTRSSTGIPSATLYALTKQLNAYDESGNLLEVKPKEKENQVYLWAYNNTFPIAKVDNASLPQIAFCDFEEDTEQGGWTFDGSSSNYSTVARTGKRAYKGATISKTVPSGRYKLSLWATGTAGSTVTVNGIAKTLGSGWTLCEWDLSAATAVTITTSGNTIDGLRIHPSNAMMETYAYEPLVGMTSSTSANNTTTFYEYDGFGRLVTVKDHNMDIVKTYKYVFKGQ